MCLQQSQESVQKLSGSFLFFVIFLLFFFYLADDSRLRVEVARTLLIALQVVRTSFGFHLRECMGSSSAINSVCEFRFVSINENAPETVSYLFPTTRCNLNQIYPSAF